MNLKVSLLQKTDPELSFVRISANQVSETVYWQIIINFNCAPNSIDEEFYYVFAARVE